VKDIPADMAIALRPGESLRGLRQGLDAGLICATCRTPVVEVWATWGRLSETEQLFPRYAHANGTPRHITSGDPFKMEWLHLLPRCSQCGEYDSLSTEQQAYGDRTTCHACGDSTWYDIGD
jgi:hypothetical protein